MNSPILLQHKYCLIWWYDEVHFGIIFCNREHFIMFVTNTDIYCRLIALRYTLYKKRHDYVISLLPI